MTRINALRSITETRSFNARIFRTWSNHSSALIFAAVLIVCSLTGGCSSDKPKPVSSNIQIPVTQPPSQVTSVPAPVVQATTKPAPKKVVPKKPATVNYTDKTYGLTFEYPRRYAIETGSAASELLASNPLTMNFVQPGGLALAAVELPETSFANTDFSSAFFNVSVNKSLTADQCREFAVPAPKMATSVSANESTSTTAATAVTTKGTDQAAVSAKPEAATDAQASSNSERSSSKLSGPEPSSSQLMIGDLELRATEAVSGEGTRQSDAKYFHVFQNGACYEFALNVTTAASEDGMMKHVDRDKVFDRLEKILATVKINPTATPEVSAEAPASTPAAETPAQ